MQHVTPLMPLNPAIRGDDAATVLAREIFGKRSEYHTPQQAAASSGVTGSGTTGKIPKWSGSSALADSLLTESVTTLNTAHDDFQFSGNPFTVHPDTVDASDTKKLSLSGGGAESTSRGALVLLHGNEHASSPGRLHLFAGLTGSIRIRGDMFWDTDNTWDIGADGATRPKNLYLGGAIINYPNGGSLSIQQSGIGGRWAFNSSGHFVTNNDDAVDIGAAGATRPRNIFIAGEILSQGSSSKSADQASFANAQTNISSLSFAIGANEVWILRAVLPLTMVGATGVKFYFTGPAGAAGHVTLVGTGAALTTVETVYTAAITVPGTFLSRIAGATVVTVHARITSAGTAGTIQLVGITGAAGTTCVVKAGAWMIAERLS